ncbi:MAG: carbohydrate binding family 9 domain-containing protein, partial [Arenicella sp.]|nr:carbohydrate binding family 9 domain-containing protein [Arenicella sp.]
MVLFTGVFACAANAQTPSTELYLISDQPRPDIDGELDDKVWATAPFVGDFHQIRPTDRGVPSEKTEVQIARDNIFIYVAFRAHDSEIESLSAKGLIQGQNFFSDDRLAVYIDTFNDRRNAYFFQVNGNGMRRDALIGNDYFIDDWSTVWYAETRLHDWGWTAEMAIPIKSVSFDPNADSWGLNFGRVHPRRGEEMAWSSRDRNADRPANAGYATGVKGFSQGLGVELAPSVAVGFLDNEEDDREYDIEPSLTTFYNVTPFLTAGLTLNTDFSATDVDDRQVNLNRFSLFFPEKREFFLRDASIFEFGNIEQNGRPFFSRRIGLSSSGTPLNIDAGVKLSGRAGSWNVGA